MAVIMIATVYSGKNLVGLRLLESDSVKKAKILVMDVSLDQIEKALLNNAIEIENVGIESGKIVGTNGILDRYTKINLSNKQTLDGKTPVVVIDQIGDAGYTLADYSGAIRKVKNEDAILVAKKLGISNGKIVIKDNIEFISSINGEYRAAKIAPSKLGSSRNLDISISMPTNSKDTSRVAKNAKVDVGNEIDANDIFGAMSSLQKKVIQDYYMWYTVEIYKSLAKTSRLNISTAKAEKIAGIKGETNWHFKGIKDAGWRGASRCTLGHSLRYEYWAAPEDTMDDKSTWIIFGTTCTEDFFSISHESMQHLIEAKRIMSEEIEIFADMIVNGLQEEYKNKIELFYNILKKIEDGNKIKSIFGEQLTIAIANFMNAGLPLPKSLIKMCTKQIKKFGIQEFFICVFPEYIATILTLFNKAPDFLFEANVIEFLKFVATNKIEGKYAYDPLDKENKNRAEGRYNKQTREERRRLLYRLGTYCGTRQFTLEEIDAVLKASEAELYMSTKIGKLFNDTNEIMSHWDICNKYTEYTDDGHGITNTKKVLCGMLFAIGKFDYSTDLLIYMENRRRGKFYNIIDYAKAIESKEALETELEKFKKFIQADIDRKSREKAEREKEQLEMQRIREERLERARIEADKIAKEEEEKRVEKERLEAEERNKKEKAIKSSTETKVKEDKESSDKTGEEIMENITELIKKHPDLKKDYGVATSLSIIQSGIEYKKLTSRQKWRLDDTLKMLSNQENKKAEAAPEDTTNKSYDFADRPDIKDMVTKIIAEKGNPKLHSLNDPILIKIAYSVFRTQRASDKQLKHIEKAIEALK